MIFRNFLACFGPSIRSWLPDAVFDQFESDVDFGQMCLPGVVHGVLSLLLFKIRGSTDSRPGIAQKSLGVSRTEP